MILTSELSLLCAASEIEPGTAKKVVLGSFVLAVFNLEGEFYITDDTCTHGFASLSEGIIDGDIVECPWHGGTFDIRSGAAIESPCTVALNTYRVVMKDGAVWVDLGADRSSE